MGDRSGPKIHVCSDRTISGHIMQSVDAPTMTLTEVATYLNVHQMTIYRAIKAGAKLGQFRIGRVWRFSREDLERFTTAESTGLSERE